MIKQIRLVEDFHKKFHAPIGNKVKNISKERYDLRYHLMNEEVQEYLEGAKAGDIQNIAKELCDILYSLYGTIIEHGLQDNIEECFEEVHKSHMSKDYSPLKMIKGKNFKEVDLNNIITNKGK